ncbi:camar1 transposase [Nephila pilipes]|uniref:Camar1 transposase n=1 Tax=Nephila pilipes TaxID=299642 RepID=A0A8X6T7H6_NEPPI|nr:camar1 transposase [Nephila pilipes]
MLSVRWTGHQVVHYELLTMDQTVIADLYSQELEWVQQALQQQEPELLNGKGVLFLHDHLRLHAVGMVKDTIQRIGWEILCYPPYSTDIAISNNHLFHSQDNYICGKFFTNEADLG